jgi:hypothetical protein
VHARYPALAIDTTAWLSANAARLVSTNGGDGVCFAEAVRGSEARQQPKGTAMSSESKTTTDHEEIRAWVEEHDGTPASVRGTERGGAAGVLRIDFPGGAGEDELEHISWERGAGA